MNYNKYILVMNDQFTKLAEAFAVRDPTTETTAKKLVEEFIARFGAPFEIHTDQGWNFQSDFLRQSANCLGSQKPETPLSIYKWSW